jgi:acetyltransferase-like isoleucine patch superfamily enzyme
VASEAGARRRATLRRAHLRALHRFDQLKLRAVRAWHEGLEVDAAASPSFGSARYRIAPGGRVRIAAGATTERLPGALSVLCHEGAEILVEEGAWLRTEVAPVVLVAFPGARLRIGPDTLLNGCSLSAKQEVRVGRKAMIGPGSRVYDSDQHPLDAERPERSAPVVVEEFAWVASDVTVLRGVTIGAHAIVGTRSLVLSDVPPHTLVAGSPARVLGPVGDRSSVT